MLRAAEEDQAGRIRNGEQEKPAQKRGGAQHPCASFRQGVISVVIAKVS
jgi:hypothetical protein